MCKLGVSKSITSLARFLDTSMIVEKTLKAGIAFNIVRSENQAKNMEGQVGFWTPQCKLPLAPYFI